MKTGTSSWISGLLVIELLMMAGCQSWSGGFPMQTPARVPPPPTGSYQVPSSYYNNTGGAVSQVYQGVDPLASGQSGTNAGFAVAPGVATQPTAVQAAAFAAPTGAVATNPNYSYGIPQTASGSTNAGSGMNASTAMPNSNPAASQASGHASATLSDAQDVPSLDWQP